MEPTLDWRTELWAKGWGSLSVVVTGLRGPLGGVTLILDNGPLISACLKPHWFKEANEVPTAIEGAIFETISWSFSRTQAGLCEPPPHAPNLVFLAEKRQPQNPQTFAELLSRCLNESVALKCGASVSTPNLEWAVVLVPVEQPAKRFYGYFLPFKHNLDVRTGATWDVSWLDRRLKERRNKEEPDIKIWRQDRRVWQPNPKTGVLPAEANVRIGGYNEGSGPVHVRQSVPSGSMHTSLVKSVLPGHIFMYSMWPWRLGPSGFMEPFRADQHASFLKECRCGPGACGKLDARRALKAIREDGVQFRLEARRAPMPCLLSNPAGQLEKSSGAGDSRGNSDPTDAASTANTSSGPPAAPTASSSRALQLGVYAAELIPAGAYVVEYVGELLTSDQHRATLSRADLPQALLYADATHLGNIARFINHSCEGANLQAVNVCMGGMDETHMAILLRAQRPIYEGDELKLDYNLGIPHEEKAEIREKKGKKGEVECRCGAALCLGVVFPYRYSRTGSTAARMTVRVASRTAAAAAAATPFTPSPSATTTETHTADTVGAAASMSSAKMSPKDAPRSAEDDDTGSSELAAASDEGLAAVAVGSALKARRNAPVTLPELGTAAPSVPVHDRTPAFRGRDVAAEAADTGIDDWVQDDFELTTRRPLKALRRSF